MKSENKSHVNQTIIDLITNPNFIFFSETTGLPSNWDDPTNSRKVTFSCTIKFTDGWNDFLSFQFLQQILTTTHGRRCRVSRCM